MQVALPISQPVERQLFGLAAILLVGLSVIPLPLPERTDIGKYNQYNWSEKRVNIQSSQFGLYSLLKEKREWLKINENFRNKKNQMNEIVGREEQALALDSERLEKSMPYLAEDIYGTEKEISNSAKEDQGFEGSVSNLNEIAGATENPSANLAQNIQALDLSSTAEISELDQRKLVTKIAVEWLGTPYLYGGESRAGIDCSALVQKVFNQINIQLPRTSWEQFRCGVGVPKERLLPGDLVFFSTSGAGASHVGIYIGKSYFISATTKQVEVQSLDTPYWKTYYRGSRRIIEN